MGVNNYLTSPSSYSIDGLFIQPYKEALHNIEKAASPKSDLLGRVTHLVLGMLLLIPVLNTITLLFLRLIGSERENNPKNLNLAPRIQKRGLNEPILKKVELTQYRDSPQFRSVAPFPKLSGAILGDEGFILDFVDEFLCPYITGKITKENEPADRLSLDTQLWNAIKIKGMDQRLKKEEVSHLAIFEYGLRSSYGFMRINELFNLRYFSDDQLRNLMQALINGLAKDFPDFRPDHIFIGDQFKLAEDLIQFEDRSIENLYSPLQDEFRKLETLLEANKQAKRGSLIE